MSENYSPWNAFAPESFDSLTSSIFKVIHPDSGVCGADARHPLIEKLIRLPQNMKIKKKCKKWDSVERKIKIFK